MHFSSVLVDTSHSKYLFIVLETAVGQQALVHFGLYVRMILDLLYQFELSTSISMLLEALPEKCLSVAGTYSLHTHPSFD